jgi:N-acetylneuraminic acid mutarotase
MAWQTKASLAEQKSGLAAVTADAPGPASGSRIYAIGGASIDKALGTVEVFDSQANDWTSVAPMPTARAFHGAAVTPARIHVIGGVGDFEGVVLPTHEVYDTATNTWSTAAPMPTARQCLDVVTGSDGLVYAIGGVNADQGFATVEAYEPAADAWTTRAPMPTARAGLATVLGPDGLIYAIGGSTGEVSDSAVVEIYNPATDAWKAAAPLPINVTVLAATVGPNGLIYVIGGVVLDASKGTMEPLHNVYSYDPATPAKGWSTRAPLPTARWALAAATGADGLVYAMGGVGTDPVTDKPVPLDSVEAYVFAENDGVAIDGIDVADLLKDLVGKTVGGAIRGAGGGLIVGGHYIPIPPRSPVWSKVLGAAREYLDSGIDSPQLRQMVEKLQPRPGRATRQPNLGKRPGGKLR